MEFLLAAIGMSFAAFYVWLSVRIFNRRERWAKRTAVGIVIAVLVTYPLSFGPAHWYLNSRPLQFHKLHSVAGFYRPLRWVAASSRVLERSVLWYADLWSPETPFIHYRSSLIMRKPTKKDAVLFW